MLSGPLNAATPVAAAPRKDKRASRIAREIEADIVRRGWPVGATLGSESALQQRFGVSRSVLREAVRLVEHHQVARMRRGPNGGLIVCEPDARPATRAVVIYLEYRNTTLDDLLDARLVLEPLAAALAAEHIDEAGIETLRSVLRAEEQWRPGLPAPRDDFHLALAERSKNPVLRLFIDVLMRLTKRYARDSRTASGAEANQAVDRLHSDHAAILAAVTAGDSARAKTLSERHVAGVTTWLRQHQGDARRRRTSLPRARPDAESPGDKLAEVLAATIAGDIVASGRQVGSVFGTEQALLDRYRVSRAVLREAVRLLEYHAVAHMRRGPGGGLVVTEPEAQASIDTIALYLQYRKPTREDLRCVRDAIEINNVAKVVKRRDEPEVAGFLASHRPHLEDTASGDFRLAAVEEFRFHVGLARLAGNAPLDLFLRIIVELFRRHWSSTGQAMPTWSDVVAVERAHLRILEAVRAGDDSLARYRVRRHLDAAASWWL
ncbi:FadR/GntR family transcriptional regulator [Mycobacterium bourgelatii]|uniref:GntR family transcriptional regulator n=1 Tax=Mycobacterium bourgelatii TaxID=1273442 RepID=A0A7I9YLC6_MYCBU|nr:FCD domain-containing protein [Mycobacterium bourgelatii]MCV6978098.1 FadR family transcriptional regulator [Mycobacterium bourgelatii]GFG89480.1 GntR family transcriptional regulator [Mycobacterium bourgelatii]